MASRHDILSVLQDVQSGALTPEDALLHLKLAPFEDLGYAKVDYHRAVRQGVPEVIYGQSKTKEQISGILAAMEKQGCVNRRRRTIWRRPSPCSMSPWRSWRWCCPRRSPAGAPSW